MTRRPLDAHELREQLDDAPGPNPAGNVDRQAFAGELIDDRQALQAAAIGAGIDPGGSFETGAPVTELAIASTADTPTRLLSA